jgi:glycosyltransferase involved in cell wall biosynthesis
MSELVSILIPCYNAERWIAQAIESALAQTWSEKEIFVVDDGSTDGSLDVIREYDGRIRWETGPNRGGNVARNRLLELARGEWVQYLDADDYLLPDKVARQMEFLATQAHVDVLFGPVTLEHWSERGAQLELRPIPEPHDVWLLLASRRMPPTGAPLWRKQAILDVGGWKPDQPCCQEYELYLRLLIGGRRFEYYQTSGAVHRHWSNETVYRRNLFESHLRQLEIEQRLEDHLRGEKQLTSERLLAINTERYSIARSVWKYDSILAEGIMDKIRKLDHKLSPAPKYYQLMLGLLGYQAAERLLAAVRPLKCFLARSKVS